MRSSTALLLAIFAASACGSEAPPAPESPWGAVFWRDGVAWKVGGGPRVVSRNADGLVTESADPGACGGRALTGAPPGARIALPLGSLSPTRDKPPLMSAERTKSALSLLDPLLPPADRFTPAIPEADGQEDLHIDLGTVTKLRRHLAPPLLLASGNRSCTGVLAVIEEATDTVAVKVDFPGLCDTLALLPPADLDGDGTKEVVAYSDSLVALFRLDEGPHPALVEVDRWTCPLPAPAGG